MTNAIEEARARKKKAAEATPANDAAEVAERDADVAQAEARNTKPSETSPAQQALDVVKGNEAIEKWGRHLLACGKMQAELRGIKKALKENMKIAMRSAKKQVVQVDGVNFYIASTEELDSDTFKEWNNGVDYAAEALDALGLAAADVVAQKPESGQGKLI